MTTKGQSPGMVAPLLSGLSAEAPQEAQSTFHLSSPHTLSHGELIRIFQAFGYGIQIVEPHEYMERVLHCADSQEAEEALGGILPTLDGYRRQHHVLRSDRTTERLARLGFDYPSLDAAYFARFLDHCIEVGFLRPSRHWRSAAYAPPVDVKAAS